MTLGAIKEVLVPDIGDFSDVPVIEVLVKAGDSVKAEDSLVTLESDKATMDVPSPSAGIVKDVKVKLGDKVSEGSVIVTLEAAAANGAKTASPAQAAAPVATSASAPATASAAASAAATAAPAPAPAPPQSPTSSASPDRKAPSASAGAAPQVDSESFRKAHASPSVRAFARELGVDLSRVKGSGPKNRVLREDVQKY